ncbi:MAG: nitroreductase family protein [Candidatus Thermoplasmatota archaeon]|nr:nitroreductase family protein [Candidatus Thermoplasmatota archaeon]
MKVYDAIISRRTIRRFEQKPVKIEILKKCVNAGRLAPSAANLQPLEYCIVTDKILCTQVFGTLHWAAYIQPKWIPKETERPTAYIVVLVKDTQNPYYERDVGLATENIILTAEGEGLGSCILCNIERVKIQELCNIPLSLAVDSVIALGYKAEMSVVEDLKDSVKYWRDDDDILHVPKRNLDDIIHLNKFP